MLSAYAALGATPNIQYIDMPERSAAATSTSPRARSIGCARRLQWRLHRAGRRGRASTSRVFSIAPIAFADGATDNETRCSILKPCAQAIAGQTVLCVGDLMLDEFVYGEVSRISPEAPAPVIAVQRSETNIGGAGNVARNIASLGARCIFVGLVGEDEAGAKLKADAGAGKPDRGRAGFRSVAADDAQGALRLRAFFHPHAARRLGTGRSRPRPTIEQKLIDAILPQLAARRYRAAVRLRQGRADGARDPQRHRRRAKSSASA